MESQGLLPVQVDLQYGHNGSECTTLWRMLQTVGLGTGVCSRNQYAYPMIRAGSIVGLAVYIETASANQLQFQVRRRNVGAGAWTTTANVTIAPGVKSGYLIWNAGVYPFNPADYLLVRHRYVVVGNTPHGERFNVVVTLELSDA